MGVRTRSIARAFLIGAAVLPAVAAGYAAADNWHPGRVVERGSEAPVSAEVTAWGTARPTEGGSGCPQFGDAPVDAQTSAPTSGDFGVKVPSEMKTYTVVYCANGYHRKVDRYIPNDKDGTPVVPVPARLLKQSEASAEFQSDTVRAAVSALNELAYLYGINSKLFGIALQQYAELISEENGEAGDVLAALPGLIAGWAAVPRQ